MQPFMPLTAGSIQTLTEDQIEHIDQYLFRFSKLQDVLGVKLFSAILLFLGEEVSGVAFIDLFNRLEQLEIVKNYDNWIQLRIIRNELSHDYEDDPETNSIKINEIFSKKDELIKYYLGLKNYLSRFEEFG